jgi:outer membrane protein assembly factor BamD (BamD/ComL family)
VDAKEYDQAVEQADKFLKRYRGDPLREEVLSLAGDAEMGQGSHWSAYKRYERQLKEFPNGPRVERALGRELEIAKAFLAGKKRPMLKVFRIPAAGDGIEILHRIAERAPGTEQAELALLAVGDYYFDKSDWPAAIDAYDGYLGLFPKSPRAVHAELRSAEALRTSYLGPQWDETPLIEAEQRYKAILQRYPSAAATAGVANILQEIRSARARKQYTIARFYLRTGKKDAAEHYFKLAVAEYSGTTWAERAAQELSKLGPSRPAAPAPTGKDAST